MSKVASPQRPPTYEATSESTFTGPKRDTRQECSQPHQLDPAPPLTIREVGGEIRTGRDERIEEEEKKEVIVVWLT